MTNRYSVIIRWSDKDCAFVARVPEFPNLYAFGDSQPEAKMQAFIALGGYLELFAEKNIPLPEPETWEVVKERQEVLRK